ncbi:biotin--protein ligase-like isoform X1 [Lytechinus variegatus]|uniref:biotin--protein ligase-like isoform X1 n=2 Tax=Lytechinus variegatus TaxID=7654 RepID=UPI001BB146FF|nr:biotin--protein ligase-like isoform X1 [Lytechinus variegatus]
MLMTLCYIYLLHLWPRFHRRLKDTILETVEMYSGRASVAFRKLVPANIAEWAELPHQASLLCEALDQKMSTNVLEEARGKQMLTMEPKQSVDLSYDWTSFIGSSTPALKAPVPVAPASPTSSIFVLLEASPPKRDRYGRLALRKVPPDRVVKFSELTTPLAWRSGEPFGILVQASKENFSRIGTAYLEGYLELDDGLLVNQLLTVEVKGQPFNLVDSRLKMGESPSGTMTPPIPASPHKGGKPQLFRQPQHQSLRRKHSSEFLRKMEEQKLKSSGSWSSTADGSEDSPNVSESPATDGVFFQVGDDSGNLSNGIGKLSRSGKHRDDRHHARSMMNDSKPPNILVYTGSETEDEVFAAVQAALQHCLEHDKYVIYLLKPSTLSQPWSDNCALMVLAGEGNLPDEATSRFVSHFNNGGRILNFGLPLSLGDVSFQVGAPTEKEVEATYQGIVKSQPYRVQGLSGPGRLHVNDGEGDKNTEVSILAQDRILPMVVKASEKSKGGMAIFSQICFPEGHLEGTQEDMAIDMLVRLGLACISSKTTSQHIIQLTPAYLLGINQANERFLKSITSQKDASPILRGTPVSLHFIYDPSGIKHVSPSLLPVVIGRKSLPMGSLFNFDVYRNNLQTRILGNVVLYAEVLPTTMDVFDGFMFKVPDNIGCVCIATRMTGGKGRGGNRWLAPIGCAMFSLHVRIPLKTHLADKLPFLQHIASAAVVEAVRSLKGYEDFDLRLKWPNDIYYGNKQKLGGVIVNSSCLDGVFHAIIGIGVNVSNSVPTTCINDLIHKHNEEKRTSLNPVTMEMVIARSITEMEKMINAFQEKGVESFLPVYYRRWLHSDAKIRLESANGDEVTITGLDNSGFLQVKKTDGSILSVQPDGNTFDMLKNLISMKSSKH